MKAARDLNRGAHVGVRRRSRAGHPGRGACSAGVSSCSLGRGGHCLWQAAGCGRCSGSRSVRCAGGTLRAALRQPTPTSSLRRFRCSLACQPPSNAAWTLSTPRRPCKQPRLSRARNSCCSHAPQEPRQEAEGHGQAGGLGGSCAGARERLWAAELCASCPPKSRAARSAGGLFGPAQRWRAGAAASGRGGPRARQPGEGQATATGTDRSQFNLVSGATPALARPWAAQFETPLSSPQSTALLPRRLPS